MVNIDCDRQAGDAYTTPYEEFRPKAEIIVPEQAGAVLQSRGITNTSKLKKSCKIVMVLPSERISSEKQTGQRTNSKQ